MRGARSAKPSQLLLLLLLLASSSPSSTFTPKDNYLLLFTPTPLLLTTPPNSTHRIPLPLNSTSHTSPHPFSFSFPISSPANPHLLRLHFLPSSPSLFSVAASAFPILSRFSPSAPTFKEFLFSHLNLPSLDLAFTPAAGDGRAAASVAAVELYTVPDDLFPTPSAGHVLEVVHRVNAGGPLVTPENDTLWRTWAPDDWFVVGGRGRRGEEVTFSERIEYPAGGASPETAPESVYGTCREMGWTAGNSSSDKFNLTWVLPVPNSDHGYLVRLHFCDIVSKALYELYFDVYINGFSVYKDLDLSSQSLSLASPYYIDFVVNSNPSGSIHISVGPSDRSLPLKVNAILNGLEIMKIHGVAKFSEPGKKNYFGIIIGTVLGCFTLICLVLAFLTIVLRRRRRRKQKPASSESAAWSPLPGSSYSRLMELTAVASSASNLNLSLKIPFPEILLATNNFDDKSLVGSGGFGKVYRGVLRDGTAVAVKRGGRNDGSGGSRQGLSEFQAEILVLTMIRHRHLVSLIGYCDERSEMILVYEYMANGPLRDHLYGSTKPHLSWKLRLEVCIGSARGLHYLHTGTSQGIIIHRDVKSANILLDESYTAKVADFGLSRSAGPHIDQTQTHVSTGVKGSFGYLDPEYFRTQQLTEKSDVYSFGVVLLEVLCARPVIDRSLSWEEVNLAEWGIKWQKKGLLDKIIDPLLKDEIDPKSLEKFGETVVKCLAQYGVDRPAMGDVLWNLECALQLHEAAIRQGPLEDCSVGPSEVPPVRSSDVTAAGSGGSLVVATSQVFSQLASSTEDGR